MIRGFVVLIFTASFVLSAPIDLEARAKKFMKELAAKTRADDIIGAQDLVYAKFVELFPGLLNEEELEAFKAGLYGDIATIERIANRTETEEGNPVDFDFMPIGPGIAKFWKQKYDALSKESQAFVAETVKYITSFGTFERFALRLMEATDKIDAEFDKLSEETRMDVLKHFPFFGKMKEMLAIAKEFQRVDWGKMIEH